MSEPKARGIRQTMSDLHIWTGLLVGWILYAMFLTGTVSYFRDEISQYMRPELQAAQPEPPAGEVVERIAARILERTPGTPQMSISLPTPRDPVARAFWRNPEIQGRRGFEQGVFDATTGHELRARDTTGGDFFYGFHFNLHYVPVLWGRWIAGFCAMFMLVAIVSGVITHKKIFIDFFTFRWGKGQRSWLDAHSALSVLGLPFHFIITYSGLITLMTLYMPWGMQTLQSPAQRQEVTSEMRLFLPAGKLAGEPAALVSVANLVYQAEQRWGMGSVGNVQIQHAGDTSARVAIVRQQSQQVATTPRYLLFDGHNGELLKVKESSGAAASAQGVMYGLHMGRFADIVVRWLYFIVSLAGTAMVGTGLVLWTVKRRARLPDPERPYFGFRLVERLNIASIAGLSVAMPAFLWGNRLLPVGMAQRSQWEVNLFFIVWGGSLLYALTRPAKRAWVELLWLAAALLALLPVVNAFTTDRPLWSSIAHGDWVYAGLECTLLILALLHAGLAIRTARRTPRRKAQPQRRPPQARQAPAARSQA